MKNVREACDFMIDKSFAGSKLEDPNALASLPSSSGNSYQPPLPVITPKAQACGDFFLNDLGGFEEDPCPFHEHNITQPHRAPSGAFAIALRSKAVRGFNSFSSV